MRTVQRLLQNAAHLGWRGRRQAPKSTPRHIVSRKKWARNILAQGKDSLKETVWSDEKRFNLDGPDGFDYYWVDLRAERGIRSRHQNGGGRVMIWGCFSFRGRLKVTICERNLNISE